MKKTNKGQGALHSPITPMASVSMQPTANAGTSYPCPPFTKPRDMSPGVAPEKIMETGLASTPGKIDSPVNLKRAR